jgi:predicted DNA-binding transcriptional regulator AlpA
MEPNLKAPKTLLNERDIARIIGMSVASVRRWRLRDEGPPYLKLSSAVRYRPEDLKLWLDSRPMGGGKRGGNR